MISNGRATGMPVATLGFQARKRLGRSLSCAGMMALAIVISGCSRRAELVAERMVALDAIAPVHALRTYYPDDYDRLFDRVRAAETDADVIAATDKVLGDVILRQRPKADAQTSRELFVVAQAEGRALQATDPLGCASLLDGRGAQGLAKVLTPAMVAQGRAASAKLLAQTATRPQPPAQAMTADRLLEVSMQAVSTLPEEQQETVLRLLRSEKDPATLEEGRAMCAFSLALTGVVLAPSPQAAGDQVRAFWAMQ